ncbi:cell surface A33 antigen [Nematolebias whitei]|uniref:cell surface A33 antigen n=1 Tax=Nematolebias whitei TaxID=451745 RepID=UPI0018976E62|nr:cell surface A33 antigen [Nematolebias whitei]
MSRRMQFPWQELIFILTVLPCCWSLQVSIQSKEYKVAKGKDVTLVCSFVPAVPVTDNFFLSWDTQPDVHGEPLKAVASYFLNKPVVISPSYEGKAFLEIDIRGGTSKLRLTQLTMKDSRLYQCSVRIYGDDGTTAATTSLLVLEPPSPPACKLHGRAEYFHNVNLTCESAEGSPKPVYQWTTYSVENIPRQFAPKTTQKDGVLSLFNISRETSGFFICVSKNEIDSASCNFTLAVMPGSMNLGSTARIIGGVLAGLVVLGVIIFCCCRKRSKKDIQAEDSPGDMVFYDKEGPEAGEQYQDNKSNSEEKPVSQYEDKDSLPQNKYRLPGMGKMLEDDQHSYNSGKDRPEDIYSQPYKKDKQNPYRGSQDRLDDPHDRHGSQDRLDDQQDRYGSRDRLDEPRDRHGSRDRLDDHRDRHGSRNQLDDQRDRYGSRDQLDDHRDRYGSRDRLDDHRDRHGSRDRLDDQRDRYGSRDRLDDQRDRYGSRDRLDDR